MNCIYEGEGVFTCINCGFACQAQRIERECQPSPDAPTPLSVRGPCQHRGQELRQVPCVSCGNGRLVKVFSCNLYNECTVGKEIDGLACCASCPDYANGIITANPVLMRCDRR